MGDIVAAFCFVLFWGKTFGPIFGPFPNPGMSQEVYRRYFPRGISQEVFPRRYRYTGGMAGPADNYDLERWKRWHSIKSLTIRLPSLECQR